MRRLIVFLISTGIGTLATVLTAAVSHLASTRDAESTSEILFWPNTLMQSLVPLHNIGTPEQPFYEGTPLNVAAFFISFPLGIFVYSVLAYILVTRWQRNARIAPRA